MKKDLAVRIGTAFLILADGEDRQPGEIVEALVEAIEDDPRVASHVENQELKGYYPVLAYKIFPSDREVLTGEDLRIVLAMKSGLRFNIHVPKKNQPLLFGINTLASEDYVVAWDGVTIVVGCELEEDKLPRMGGQIVEDILRTAAHAIGVHIQRQGCDLECPDLFSHVVVGLRRTDSPQPLEIRPADPGEVEADIGPGSSVEEVVSWFFTHAAGPGRLFSEAKNKALRAQVLERALREARERCSGACTTRQSVGSGRRRGESFEFAHG